MTDETLVDIAVDRKVTTLDLAALLYAVNGSPASLDAVIALEDLINQITNIIGTRYFEPLVVDFATDVAVGDGAYNGILIPAEFNGWNLTYVRAKVITAGTTNSTTIQIHNATDAVDMLSTKLTIASGATLDDGNAVIDTTKDDVATDDILRIDIDTVSTTPPQGLVVVLGFTRP